MIQHILPISIGFTKTLLFVLYSLLGFAVAQQSSADCSPASCDRVLEIRYPFWLDGKQANNCGYPGMKLFCDNHSNTFLMIANRKYRVLKIFYDNTSVLVSDSKFWDTNCSVPYSSPSFAATQFNISTANKKLYFYSNCSTAQQRSLYNITCASPKSLGLEGYCKNMVTMPVYNNTGKDTSNYRDLLRNGFLLKWNVTDCSECSASGGQCGYSSSWASFACLCRDRDHRRSCKRKTSRRSIQLGIGIGAGGLLILSFIFCFVYQSKRRQQLSSSGVLLRASSLDYSSKKDPEIGGALSLTQTFSYRELKEATDGFSDANELGDGGFGTVYKGVLHDGRTVAVKRLYQNNYKRLEQFLNEVEILSRLRHQNLVTLYGCSARQSRELLLVYEFVPNGTVADHLHGSLAADHALSWPIRMNIAIETAGALAYLHAIEPQIIHRDVKTTNILLDNEFHVKVGDFGLSRLFPVDATHVSTAPQGTPGYLDPEYHQCYQLTDKSDVYSFGVVLVELISSKPAVDISRHRHEINLSSMAINKIQNNELDQLVDLELGFSTDMKVKCMITQVAELAFRCLQADREMRPPIKEVLEVLKGIESGSCDKTNNRTARSLENDQKSRNDAELLKNVQVFSPTSVQDWVNSTTSTSTTTTPNTSS